jgi:flagellar assembly protein FliH
MKLSPSNRQGVLIGSKIDAWKPDDFDFNDPEMGLQEIEEMSSLFPTKSLGNSLEKESIREKCAVWLPTDFNHDEGKLFSQPRNEWWPGGNGTGGLGENTFVKDPYFKVKGEAERILLEARAQAEVILKQAHKDAEVVGKQAYSDAVAKVQWEMQTSLQATKEILNETVKWCNEVMSQSEGCVLALVKDIARLLFTDGIQLDEITLQQTFNKAIANARTLGDLRIYINPDDAQVLDPSWREFQSSVSGQKVQVIPSNAIRRGGCYIEGQLGSVDARVETQMEEVLLSLSPSSETK